MDFDPGAVPASIERYDGTGKSPAIVSISDIHGYLKEARSALRALGETAEYDPIVTEDADGRLHWANNDYLLLVNGDLIDRGPHNDECLELVERLAREAPSGRIRYHLGNHEVAVLFPERFHWPGTYSIDLDRERRRSFIGHVADGLLPVAFEGNNYTYSHAGSRTVLDVAAINEQTAAAGSELLAMLNDGRFDDHHGEVIPRYEAVFGLGDSHGGRGPTAGLLWMDFQHMPPDAPPQIVGHSRQPTPTRRGQGVCQNVIRSNRNSPGGEAVLVEHEDRLDAVIREADGVTVTEI